VDVHDLMAGTGSTDASTSSLSDLVKCPNVRRWDYITDNYIFTSPFDGMRTSSSGAVPASNDNGTVRKENSRSKMDVVKLLSHDRLLTDVSNSVKRALHNVPTCKAA
jgi:hypothetical protein